MYKVISQCTAAGADTLALVPTTSNLHAYLRQISTLLLQAKNRTELVSAFTLRVAQALFDPAIDNRCVYSYMYI